MILWNDIPVKHSILMAGEAIDIGMIETFLKDGIKVIWFGTDHDRDSLKQHFGDYIKYNFLNIYDNTDDVRLVLIDGNDNSRYHKELVLLETGDQRFNLHQYEIEHDGDAPLVIVQAGAGSGKTFVMNNRLLYLIHTREDFHLRDVVMMTFTNEATNSMRRKLIELLNTKLLVTGNIRYLKWIEEVPQIHISTIHSFLYKIIKEVGPILGYGTNLRMTSMIMEKRRILRDIMDHRYGDSSRPVDSVLGSSLYDLEKLASQFWKKIENNGLSEYEVFSMDWGSARPDKAQKIQDTLKQIFEEVEERYNIIKLENNAISMSDIIHEFSRVVNDDRVKEYITSHYRYLFCDEFQDSDDVQIKTIVVLDKIYDGNLFVVGDIKQSIYRFRGATDSAFERLKTNVVETFGRDHIGKPYSLSKNYRTSKDILNEVDMIFRSWADRGYIQYKYTGEYNDVLTPQEDEPGIYKQIKIFRKSELEDKFIALLDRLSEEPATSEPHTTMVLTRNNWQLQKVKEWCENAGKACLIRERGAFFKSPAVREFFALVSAFQFSYEPMYLYNLLQTSYCYKNIDLGELSALHGTQHKLTTYFIGIIQKKMQWEGLLDAFRNRPVMSVLCELISEIRPSIVYGAIQKKKYAVRGYSIEEGTKQAVLDAKQYEADLQKLMQMLSEEFADEFSSLSDIIDYLQIKINTDTEEEHAEIPNADKTDCIQGSTVHGAKGLEFYNVIIPFTTDPFVKNGRSEILMDKEKQSVGWQYKKNDSDEGLHNELYERLREKEALDVVRDETRLLYVAMTRPIGGLYCFTWWKRNPGIANTWSDLLPEEKDDADYL